ncbi:hypothetical protein TrVE_jg11470 [Triparma verrucosa]|uniref:Uncharacterized protein n=1 Tax=Triparma verrucosa TaxID=1606542 RepID=A0A9W7C736_9STRA|nr:hypothetical protein TrVE_jg11470 [Triparma verrucosa]
MCNSFLLLLLALVAPWPTLTFLTTPTPRRNNPPLSDTKTRNLKAKEEVDEVAVEGAQFFGGAAAKDVLLDDSEDLTYTKSTDEGAASYFKNLDVAIIGGEMVSPSTIDIRWKVALNWPTFWLPRIAVGGVSRIEFDSSSLSSTRTALSWSDKLNGSDSISLESRILDQILPRFWDTYHIGMAPSCELKERFEQKVDALFPRPYKLFKSPATLELRASIRDKVGRSGRLASCLPDSMFSNIIKTVGPSTEKYVPSGPVEISISSAEEDSKESIIEWAVPVPSNFIAANENLLPVGDSNFLDDEEMENGEVSSSDAAFYDTRERPYLVITPKRQFATIKFGGSAQDDGIGKARKSLYDAVTKDGHKIMKDEKGRPKFFFLQNNAKVAWTEKGLGMAIYEWRPDYLQTNEVGIELEFTP